MAALGAIVANPYQAGGMIRDPEQFHGRTREIREILSRVATMQSVSIFGERLIGKSSLLHYIVTRGAELLPDRGLQFHYLTLQSIDSVEEFYRRAYVAISGAQPAAGDRDTSYDKDDLEEVLRDKQVVLCLDEFESAIEQDFDPDFFHVMRSLAQFGHLALLVSSKRPLSELCRQGDDWTSSFYNIFTAMELGAFTDAEAEAFVAAERQGHTFQERERRLLRELAENHPYWLSLACAIAFDVKQEADKAFEQEVRQQFDTARRAVAPAIARPISQPPEMSASAIEQERQAWILALVLGLIGFSSAWLGGHTGNPVGIVVAAVFLGAGLTVLSYDLLKRKGN